MARKGYVTDIRRYLTSMKYKAGIWRINIANRMDGMLA
jgi:hypothetical protein